MKAIFRITYVDSNGVQKVEMYVAIEDAMKWLKQKVEAILNFGGSNISVDIDTDFNIVSA